MLNAIRVAAANWLGRVVLTVIMGLLIVSFAIWGIGDIFRGGIDRTLVKVGSTKISADEYRNTLNTELRRLQIRTRRAVTMDEVRAYGLDRTLLNRKIDEAALSQEADRLGLALAPELVLSSIMDAADFKTAGQFDRAKLSEALSQAGISEKDFVRLQEEHLKRLELFNGLLGGFAAPAPMLEAINVYRAGTRDVEAIQLDPAKVPAPAAPDEAAMKEYYETHRADFRTVETRKASVIALSLKDFAGTVTLSEDELKAFYAAAVAAGTIGTPEKRKLERVLFDTEAEAKAAAEKIAAGTTFEALLAERKLSAADVEFGTRVKADMADPAQRDALFAAPAGKVIGPFKDAFGFVLYRVAGIEAAKVPSFESQKGGLEAQAREEKLGKDAGARAKFEAAVKAIEEQKLSGQSLAEAAKAAKVALTTLAALDREGGDGAGARVSVPGGTEMVAAIFASDIGLDNDAITEKDGTRYYYEVNAVEPARERPFEDVKAVVAQRLDALARDKALLAQANDLIKRIGGGEPLAKVAQELGLKVESFKGIRRGQRGGVLGGSGTDRAFSAPVGTPVTALASDGAHRLVIVPVKAEVPPFDAAAMERAGLTAQVAQGMADDMMAGYTAGLRQSLGVSINQQLLEKTLGQAAN